MEQQKQQKASSDAENSLTGGSFLFNAIQIMHIHKKKTNLETFILTLFLLLTKLGPHYIQENYNKKLFKVASTFKITKILKA